jgi:hypothetical protein
LAELLSFALLLLSATFGIGKKKMWRERRWARVIDRKKKCCEINSGFDHMGG